MFFFFFARSLLRFLLVQHLLHETPGGTRAKDDDVRCDSNNVLPNTFTFMWPQNPMDHTQYHAQFTFVFARCLRRSTLSTDEMTISLRRYRRDNKRSCEFYNTVIIINLFRKRNQYSGEIVSQFTGGFFSAPESNATGPWILRNGEKIK